MEIDTIEVAITKLSDTTSWENDMWLAPLFAQISQIAYLDKAPAKKYFKSLGFTKHVFINIDGAQAHIVEDKENIVFAFRGTQPTQWNDISADLKSWKMKSRTSGRVHDGFYDETNKLWPKIENHKIKNKKVWICGHSLGAAMALICATRLYATKPKLFTYGCPRVGNSKWLSACTGVTTPYP